MSHKTQRYVSDDEPDTPLGHIKPKEITGHPPREFRQLYRLSGGVETEQPWRSAERAVNALLNPVEARKPDFQHERRRSPSDL